MSTWNPNGQSLIQLVNVLVDSLSPSHERRSNAMEVLESFKFQPEFLNYLCYILVEAENDTQLCRNLAPIDLQNCRAAAGMYLKNSILQDSKEYNLDYVKHNIIQGLFSPISLISNITGIVITTLFSTYYRQNRSDCNGIQMISQLLELASQGNEASIKALSKIMEDNAQFFQLEWSNSIKPMEFLVNNLLSLMTYEGSAVIRAEAIKCINTIIPLQAQSFVVRADEFLSNLFGLAQHDEDRLVRIQLCISLVNLLEFRPDKLLDHLNGIVQFVLHIMNTVTDESLTLEAGEFLLAFASNSHIPENVIKPFINDIIPLLLSKMVYNEEDVMIFEASNENDADLEDKDEDIRPVSAKLSKKRDDGNLDDDEDEDDGDVDTQWNLRKCSAATLDVLTSILPRDVLSAAFPFLREHLSANQWFIREATILALGAMAEGGMKYFTEQLPTLIPFLVEELKDEWAPVRTITCWTLARFAPWILQDNTQFLIPVIEPIMNALMDKKKSVQEAAISSVAVFIETCDSEIVETLLYNELLAKFNQCFQFYQKKNLIILYDAVGRLAEKCEFDETAMELILPHLIGKWTSLADNDKELWPLLECLSYIAASLGEKFLPMAPDVYSRAWRILCQCVELEEASQSNPNIEVPEKDFMITSLDLIDGLVQGLGSNSQELLFPKGNTSMFHVMLICLRDSLHEVRQSCFALLGDIAYFFQPQLIATHLVDFLRYISNEILHNDDNEAAPSLNNAIWSLGLISEKIDLAEYIIDLSRIVLDAFTDTTKVIQTSIMENLAVTIGRMAHFHPEIFTSGAFATDSNWSRWCEHAANLSDPEEKAAAYGGFLKIMNLTDTSIPMSSSTIHKFIQGISRDVEIIPFLDDLRAFLMSQSSTVQNLKLSEEEIFFLQQMS